MKLKRPKLPIKVQISEQDEYEILAGLLARRIFQLEYEVMQAKPQIDTLINTHPGGYMKTSEWQDFAILRRELSVLRDLSNTLKLELPDHERRIGVHS